MSTYAHLGRKSLKGWGEAVCRYKKAAYVYYLFFFFPLDICISPFLLSHYKPPSPSARPRLLTGVGLMLHDGFCLQGRLQGEGHNLVVTDPPELGFPSYTCICTCVHTYIYTIPLHPQKPHFHICKQQGEGRRNLHRPNRAACTLHAHVVETKAA